MSRRKKSPLPPPAPVMLDGPGPQLLRKLLLALLTTWIVARPLIHGDDPGLVHPWTDATGLVLTQIGFILALGWAMWRWWSGQGAIHAGLVEVLLLGTTGLVLFGFTSASYRHPAILIGWEWVSFLLGLFVLRQLTVSEGEQRGVTAVLLASAVSLAAHGVVQYAFKLPPGDTAAQRQALLDERLRGLFGPQFVETPPPQEVAQATATFATADELAGYLMLLLPVVAAAAIVRWRHNRLHWQTWLTVLTLVVLTAGVVVVWWTSPPRWTLQGIAQVGLPVALLLLATLAAFFTLMVRHRWQTEKPLTDTAAPAPPSRRMAHWEFYFGGMGGLLLGYLLSQMGRSPEEALYGPLPDEAPILTEGFLAGGRSLVWFVSFALFVGVPWSRRTRALALSAGVLALALHLSVAGGINAPSVALPLWLCVGLALNARDVAPWGESARDWLRLVLPFPIAAGIGLAYFVAVFQPIQEAQAIAAAAATEGRYLLNDRRRPQPQITQRQEFIDQNILNPLLRLVEEVDPGDARLLVQLAYWYGERWSVMPLQTADHRFRSDLARVQAVNFARRAQERDPEGLAGLLMELHLHRRFAQGFKNVPSERQEEFTAAVKSAEKLVERQPSEPRWRFLHAQALFDAGEVRRLPEAAEKALEVDEKALDRRLTAAQRMQLRGWLQPR